MCLTIWLLICGPDTDHLLKESSKHFCAIPNIIFSPITKSFVMTNKSITESWGNTDRHVRADTVPEEICPVSCVENESIPSAIQLNITLFSAQLMFQTVDEFIVSSLNVWLDLYHSLSVTHLLHNYICVWMDGCSCFDVLPLDLLTHRTH